MISEQVKYKLGVLFFFGFVFTGCHKINDLRNRKEFQGIWILEQIVETTYDTLGNQLTEHAQPQSGELVFSKDYTYTNTAVSEINGLGKWEVDRVGKQSVIYFWDDPQSESKYWQSKVNVSHKTKNKMQWAYFSLGSNGALTGKKEYFFNASN